MKHTGTMTKDALRGRHKFLHECLDELLACYIAQRGEPVLKTQLGDFLKWSFEQTQNPACAGHSEKQEQERQGETEAG